MHFKRETLAFHWPIFLIASLISIHQALANPQIDSPNVCNYTEKTPVSVQVPTQVSYEVEYQGTCAGFIPCKKTRKSYRNGTKIEMRMMTTTVHKCCPGFFENARQECVALVDNEVMSQAVDQLMAKNLSFSASSERLDGANLAGEPRTSDVATRVVATHVGINLLLVIIVFALGLSLYQYRTRLRRIKDELYYVAYNTSGSEPSNMDRSHGGRPSPGGSSNNCGGAYSINGSSTGSHQYEPGSVLAAEASYEEYPDKQQSFSTATRTVLFKNPASSSARPASPSYLVNPKLEKKLAESQVNSESNFYQYLQAPSCTTSPPIHVPSVTISRVSSSQEGPIASTPSISDMANGSFNGDYQVPRPTSRPLPPVNPVYMNNDDDQSNLYEEIKPKNNQR